VEFAIVAVDKNCAVRPEPQAEFQDALEPRRVCRRLCGLSYAAKAVSCN
jgi:hypothetical protein